MNPAVVDAIERLCREKILDITGALRMSSVEISRTSTGKPGFSVKVYNPDPIAAVNKAREIEQRLAVEYGMIQTAQQGNLFEQPITPAPRNESAAQEQPPPDEGDMAGWDN